MKSDQPRLLCLMWLWILTLLCGCSLTAAPRGDIDAAAVIEGPPVVRILSPLPNQTFMAGAAVMIQARVENAGPDLARVSVLLDDALVGEEPNPNEIGAAMFSVKIDWPTSNPGQYEIAVLAERGDGSLTRETVAVSVVDQAELGLGDDSGEQNADAADASESSRPTAPPPTDIPTTLRARVTTVSNLREGPGTQFALVERAEVDQEIELVAANPAGDWYKIRHARGEAWIYAELVSARGDVDSLPRVSPVNLIVTDIAIDPHPLVCQQTSEIQVTVKNEGTAALPGGGWIKAEAVLKSSEEILEAAETVFPSIAPGGEYTARTELAVSLHYNETQRIRVTLRSLVDESSEGGEIFYAEEYVLQQGSCP